MAKTPTKELKQWILNIAAYLRRGEVPPAQYYSTFILEPEFSTTLVNFISTLDEDEPDSKHSYYSAAVFALDVYVSQLQILIEAENKQAVKKLNELMALLTRAISMNKHSLSFWLPILNAFYEVHIELSPELRNAYLELIEEEPYTPEEEGDKLHSMRELILELSDLSPFDITENFFAQSYAMPAIFFPDLVMDLFSIDEGHDIALLTLLHPNAEVREHIVATFDEIIETITLSSISLTRLQTIQTWYPDHLKDRLSHWIKVQRKKGVVFANKTAHPTLKIQASEVDGGGAQGIFILFNEKRKKRLSSLLFKLDHGLKDCWMTPPITTKELNSYYAEAFEENITLRDVDVDYLQLMGNHFLALTRENHAVPDLHFLEIEELTGLQFIPQKIDIDETLNALAVLIHPFTPERIENAFSNTKTWSKTKSFTESWYLESAEIDKLVNGCCSFNQGTKVCMIEDAIDALYEQVLEPQRKQWVFHFLWVTLWLKSRARKNEKTWQDSYFIAHAIHTGTPLKSIPILHEICSQSVINSIETMQERRTYLA